MCKWSFVAFISSIRPWSGPVWWISWVQAEASHASFQFKLDYIIQIIFLKVFWPASLLRLDKKKKPGWKVVTTLSHHSTSRSSIVLLATCSSLALSLSHSHFFPIMRSCRNKLLMLVSDMHGRHLRLCGGLWAQRRCLWSVCCLVSAPPWEKTRCASSLLLFDTAVCVLPPSHALTRARDKYVNWAGDRTVQRNDGVCVCFRVCVVF